MTAVLVEGEEEDVKELLDQLTVFVQNAVTSPAPCEELPAVPFNALSVE